MQTGTDATAKAGAGRGGGVSAESAELVRDSNWSPALQDVRMNHPLELAGGRRREVLADTPAGV